MEEAKLAKAVQEISSIFGLFDTMRDPLLCIRVTRGLVPQKSSRCVEIFKVNHFFVSDMKQ